MDNRPIGVFDSGLGGLTAVVELQDVLPHEEIIYFGDTGRVPYGTKSVETLKRYTNQDISFLKSKNVKMILAACGTASSVAGDVGENCSLPYTGVLRPTAAAAVKATKNEKVGVIATPATIKSGSYEDHIKRISPSITVFSRACPLFVPFVETGHISKDDPMVKAAMEEYLTDLKVQGIDTLILGCTHYPLLSEAISEFMGKNVTLINSGKEAAGYCAQMLRKMDMLSDRNSEGKCEYYVSDSTESFYENANMCLKEEIKGEVYFTDINNF